MDDKYDFNSSNFSPSPDFKWLCDELFVKLDNIRNDKLDDRRKSTSARYFQTIVNFINLWRRTVGPDIYPALVLILPYRDRRVYNIKEASLIKWVCSYLRLQKNSNVELKLLRWKHLAANNENLSKLCVDEIAKRKKAPKEPSGITIDELNLILDNLATQQGQRSAPKRNILGETTLLSCLDSMSFLELKYFFDIILKYRMIGSLENMFLKCWHPDAKEYLSVVSDLSILCKKLRNPKERIHDSDLRIKVGWAFGSQLAKRLTTNYDVIAKKLSNNFFIEEKMDGERVQVHYMDSGSTLKFFSRQGIDYTYLYGKDKYTGTIGCFLKLDNNIENCVLDGEMVTYDSENNKVLPFGIVKSTAMSNLCQQDIETSSFHPVLLIFDILYLNGMALNNMPFFKRREFLEKAIIPVEHRVEVISSQPFSQDIHIKKGLDIAISRGSEGIVLKQYSSRYVPNNRGASWIKIKPEYLEEFGENMDLIVIGKDSGKKDSFMCGLLVFEEKQDKIILLGDDTDSSQPDKHPSQSQSKVKNIISFCSISNGLSREELRDISISTRGKWKRYKDIEPPTDFIQLGNRKPEYWILPQDSIVLEVKGRSLDKGETTSKNYKTGYTLHGGFCRQVRKDKNWETCYTLQELLLSQNSKHSISRENNHIVSKNRKRKSKKMGEDLEVKRKRIHISTNIFEGTFFYIMSDLISEDGLTKYTRDMLITKVLSHGGTVVYNIISKILDPTKLMIISSKYTNECSELIMRNYDIFHPQWILDSIENSEPLRLEPKYCLYVSDELHEIVKRRVDFLGDSFEAILDIDNFSLLTERLAAKDFSCNYRSVTSDLESIPIFLFYNRIIYMPESSTPITEKIAFIIKRYGGAICNDIKNSNLIVYTISADDTASKTSIATLRSTCLETFNKQSRPPTIPRIVSVDWVFESISKGFQQAPEDYPVI